MTKNKLIECCFKNIDKAKRIGRCNYVCIKCGRDVSLMWFFYQQAINSK